MKKRYTNKTFSNIGDVLNRVLHQYRPMTDPSLLRVWDIWETTVDAAIASNARPAAFKSDILLIHVSNSTWLHHLGYLKQDLMQKLNNTLGGDQIRNIHFKIGPV